MSPSAAFAIRQLQAVRRKIEAIDVNVPIGQEGRGGARYSKEIALRAIDRRIADIGMTVCLTNRTTPTAGGLAYRCQGRSLADARLFIEKLRARLAEAER